MITHRPRESEKLIPNISEHLSGDTRCWWLTFRKLSTDYSEEQSAIPPVFLAILGGCLGLIISETILMQLTDEIARP